jgi:hypothetical protein
MAEPAHHSRVFAVTRWIRDAIGDAPFPTSSQGETPQTSASIIGQDQPGEWVSVVNDVGDDATIDWVVLGAKGRDETFRVRIVMYVGSTGMTDTEVEDRLEELAEVVQGIFYTPDSRTITTPEPAGVVNMSRTSQVSYGIWPTREGFAGSAELVYEARCRI